MSDSINYASKVPSSAKGSARSCCGVASRLESVRQAGVTLLALVVSSRRAHSYFRPPLAPVALTVMPWRQMGRFGLTGSCMKDP